MVTSQTWTSDFCQKVTRFLLIKEKVLNGKKSTIKHRTFIYQRSLSNLKWIVHGETFYINFYYSIFQFREKRITLRILVSKNTKLYNNDIIIKFSIFTEKNFQSDTFFPELKNTIVKIDVKCFSVFKQFSSNRYRF